MMRTFDEIARDVYQHGPLDWQELEQRAREAHTHDPANIVTMTADQAVILLECRHDIILRNVIRKNTD
jgi:hypothetical protein